jgi:hypothetical protein
MKPEASSLVFHRERFGWRRPSLSNWIEERLMWQAGRKTAVAGGANQIEFGLADGTVEHSCFVSHLFQNGCAGTIVGENSLHFFWKREQMGGVVPIKKSKSPPCRRERDKGRATRQRRPFQRSRTALAGWGFAEGAVQFTP